MSEESTPATPQEKLLACLRKAIEESGYEGDFAAHILCLRGELTLEGFDDLSREVSAI